MSSSTDTHETNLQHGYVLSDLHMFAHRSTAADHLSTIREIAGEADFLVLNGDIFDFRWSTLAGADETAHVAVDWLASLVLGVNGCEVFYVLGNHDRFAFFADHLQGLAEQTDNFHWHASHVRLGQCLFLHGDLVFDRKCADPFGELFAPPEAKRHRAMHLGYRAIVATRAHRVAHPFVGPSRCARRIVGSLNRSHRPLRDGLTDVYFGHSHRAFSNFSYDGLLFHNTGSAVRHLRSDLLPVRPHGRK